MDWKFEIKTIKSNNINLRVAIQSLLECFGEGLVTRCSRRSTQIFCPYL